MTNENIRGAVNVALLDKADRLFRNDFSLSIAASLNAAAKRESDSASFGYFETWEEMAVRNARKNNVNSMG